MIGIGATSATTCASSTTWSKQQVKGGSNYDKKPGTDQVGAPLKAQIAKWFKNIFRQKFYFRKGLIIPEKCRRGIIGDFLASKTDNDEKSKLTQRRSGASQHMTKKSIYDTAYAYLFNISTLLNMVRMAQWQTP